LHSHSQHGSHERSIPLPPRSLPARRRLAPPCPFSTNAQKLNQLERDVILLKKVLTTANAALTSTVPRARVQMVEVLVGMGGRLAQMQTINHYEK
jgi:hypothetical protein